MKRMFVDTAKYHWFTVIAVTSGVIMLGALLLGLFGPSTAEALIDYAYECPGGSHYFTSSCTGVQLGVRYSFSFHYFILFD